MPGWSGYVLTICIMLMWFTALEKPRRANYERLWNTHHLFIVFIGVTPFASILKSIWYRMSNPSTKHSTRLRKVYFFWLCRDFGSLEYFKSLLHAVESQDKTHAIEIHAYLTAKISGAGVSNIVLNSGDTDAITRLRTPTNYGRPNWDMVFRGIRKIHNPGECSVFFCGPKGLGSQLHIKCSMYTEAGENGYKFVWGKENF